MKKLLSLLSLVREDWHSRPWWMNLVFYFCIYMTFIYLPFDLFLKPVEVDQEIWFGYTLTGWWAKATEPLHWIIYGLGAYGFWKMKTWMWPWSSVYVAQIVIAMFIWNILNDQGTLLSATISALIVSIPMVALWRSREKFDG
ncbi:MAG: hypothetical protein CMD42_03630 [Gammaproteobacteria bacterium]|nr:hypothetical protein [Gammaproteobacteria bacterium]|tara:strand:+ start:1150 stop:1575 length:426 start_codon:yes stop_codon:yes gene_type:complete